MTSPTTSFQQKNQKLQPQRKRNSSQEEKDTQKKKQTTFYLLDSLLFNLDGINLHVCVEIYSLWLLLLLLFHHPHQTQISCANLSSKP